MCAILCCFEQLQEANTFSSLEEGAAKETLARTLVDCGGDSRLHERLAVLDFLHPTTGKPSRMHLLDLTAGDASQTTTALKILKLYAVSAVHAQET